MSKSIEEKTGIHLLDQFAQFGLRYLQILNEENRAVAEAYALRMMQALGAIGGDAEEDALLGGPSESHLAAPETQADHIGSRLTKLRKGYLVEALILHAIGSDRRATTIDSLFGVLLSAELLDANARGALIARLNRMKNDGRLIDWDRETRAQEITVTAAGMERLAELMTKLLQRNELEYLEKHAAWVFGEAKPSNVLQLRVDRTS